MAYLALYRAFRPTNLNDVVRQEHIVTVLKNQITTGRIGHAYLFCGPRGTGKTSIAKIFASSINCLSPENGSPCGKCASCRALADPSNLDITEIDAASNNGVDEMRDLREKVQYPPVAGKYKVYIVDEVHMLSTAAFNALLKTLEEPPAHAVFVLATTEAEKIPATILSRCMRFDFKLIPQADLERRLEFVFQTIGKEYEKEAISAIARAGAGSVRDMLSIADTCVSYTSGKLTYNDVTAVLGGVDFAAIGSFCEDVLAGNGGAAFEKAEKFLSAGKSVGVLIKDVLHFLNAAAVAKTCRDGKSILALPDEAYEVALKVGKAASGQAILRVTEIFAQTEQTLKYSTSPRIAFETATLKASMPQKDYDIDALFARVEALEERLASGNFTAFSAPVPSPVAAAPTAKTEKKPAPVESVEDYEQTDYDIPPEMDAPPEEALVGGAYFEGGVSATKKVEKQALVTPVQEPQAPAAKPTVKAAVSGDSKATFGSFLRVLRKSGKSGVVFAMCMDLDNGYEDGVFVLYTQSPTIYNSLCKAEHMQMLEEAFAAIGIERGGFEVRLRGKQTDGAQKGIEEIKQTFGGVKIEIK